MLGGASMSRESLSLFLSASSSAGVSGSKVSREEGGLGVLGFISSTLVDVECSALGYEKQVGSKSLKISVIFYYI